MDWFQDAGSDSTSETCSAVHLYQETDGNPTEFINLSEHGSVVIAVTVELREEFSFHKTLDSLVTSPKMADSLSSKKITRKGTARPASWWAAH